jgi:hypothetical protein
MTGENKFAKGTIHWCWSSSTNSSTTALILSDGEYTMTLTAEVLVEGQRVVKPKCDLYDSKKKCERAHTIIKKWHARQSQLDVAKKLFPIQQLPGKAIPYYLNEKQRQDEEV